MDKVVHCECGTVLHGKNDDEIVAEVQKHASEVHAGLQITRDQALAMAQPEDDER